MVTETNKISISKRKSFKYKTHCAFNAIGLNLKDRKMQSCIALCVVPIIVALFLDIGLSRLIFLIPLAFLGWAMEAINTCMESIMDIVHPAYSNKVKIVKDTFQIVPILIFSAFIISWLIIVVPVILDKLP